MSLATLSRFFLDELKLFQSGNKKHFVLTEFLEIFLATYFSLLYETIEKKT